MAFYLRLHPGLQSAGASLLSNLLRHGERSRRYAQLCRTSLYSRVLHVARQAQAHGLGNFRHQIHSGFGVGSLEDAGMLVEKSQAVAL